MSFYTKTISYIDYYENSIKCKNIGHVKAEVRDDNCKLLINLRGLQVTDNVPVKVSILQNDKSGGFQNRQLATLELEEGKGEKALSLPASSIAGVPFQDIKGFHFAISKNRYGIAMLPEGEIIFTPLKKELSIAEQPQQKQAQQKKVEQRQVEQRPAEQRQVEQRPAEQRQVNQQQVEPQQVVQKQDNLDDNRIRKIKNTWENHNARYNSNHLSDDKWQQLCKMYPIIHPLKNEKDYISICPKDFVIFSKEYQKLVHNSFLLHGFYNYQHIILGKYDDIYYLGVPGTFHEREALVANMFGFEGFESVEEKETGAFGYYMTKVKI